MAYKNEIADSMEELLETLIRMVGHTNQTIDGLQRRISRLEHQLSPKEFILAKAPEK